MAVPQFSMDSVERALDVHMKAGRIRGWRSVGGTDRVSVRYLIDLNTQAHPEATSEPLTLRAVHVLVAGLASAGFAPADPPRPLTASDALALAVMVNAVRDGSPVARVDDNARDGVTYGAARSIGDRNGNHAAEKDDIRDMHMRVTLTSGFEAFWPVAELLPEIKAGLFIVNYRK